MTAVGILLSGLLLLYLGAEWLVKGSVGLARSLGIREFIIGLTVVAYGTSAPEMVVSATAALQGQSAIALGNVIGSNIANVGLILGLTAIVAPVAVEARLIRWEIPVLLITAILLPLALLNGLISRVESSGLVAVAILFTVQSLRRPQRPPADAARLVESDAEALGAPSGGGRARLSFIALLGLTALVAGGRLFVDGAVALAAAAGISERIIALTVVAAGTSAPELAASLVAAVRGHAGVAIGNVMGSNIFNIVFVLGGAGLVQPIKANISEIAVDIIFFLGFSLLAAILVRKERNLTRLEGAVLLGAYIGFVWITIAR
jgi:cation:H+ antiporter